MSPFLCSCCFCPFNIHSLDSSIWFGFQPVENESLMLLAETVHQILILQGKYFKKETLEGQKAFKTHMLC